MSRPCNARRRGEQHSKSEPETREKKQNAVVQTERKQLANKETRSQLRRFGSCTPQLRGPTGTSSTLYHQAWMMSRIRCGPQQAGREGGWHLRKKKKHTTVHNINSPTTLELSPTSQTIWVEVKSLANVDVFQNVLVTLFARMTTETEAGMDSASLCETWWLIRFQRDLTLRRKPPLCSADTFWRSVPDAMCPSFHNAS